MTPTVSLELAKDEVWKDIPRFKGKLQASCFGKLRRLYNFRKPRILHTFFRKGYQHISLSYNGVKRNYSVHILIAETFIPNLNNKPELNHRNFNRSDNRITNLEWCDKKENAQHAVRAGRYPNMKGELNPSAKLTTKQVREIKDWLKHNEWKRGNYSLLAKKYSVDSQTISDIYNGRKWKHISA